MPANATPPGRFFAKRLGPMLPAPISTPDLSVPMKPFVLFLLLAACSLCQAALELPLIFTDHMVLQREIKAPVWGKADAGAAVEVRLLGQVLSTRADGTGHWMVAFNGLPTLTEGTTLVITSGNEKVTIADVLIGEVWFASGQSNMAHPLEKTANGVEEATNHSDPLLRLHAVGVTPAYTPQWNATGLNNVFRKKSQWHTATNGQAAHFGGTPYYFAKELRARFGNVPVGILQCAVGGRPIQSFTSRESLAKNDLGRRQLAALDHSVAEWDAGRLGKDYPERLAAWEGGEKNPQLKPRVPIDPRIDTWETAALYNGMVHPQIPYGFRGALWYQGESNVKPSEEPRYYADTLTHMIRDWRRRFGHDFTFLIIQLAGFRSPVEAPQPVDFDQMQYGWPFIQNQMRIAHERVPRTGLVVINDIGEVDNIHPGNKLDVGRRLANWAMHIDYGAKIVPSGPLFKRARFQGSEVTVAFDYANGLKTRDGKPPGHFDLAGADGILRWADARIVGNKVIVSSPAVPQPTQVRYAWASQAPNANLINAAGLPASCFQASTDDPEGRGEIITP